jgi:hypothetical protein
MAYSADGFGPLGGQSLRGSRPALYVYTTTEAQTAVRVSGYFNDLSDTLEVGDMIIVHGATGGTRTVTMHIVVSNASGVVDISDGTTIGAVTDTD